MITKTKAASVIGSEIKDKIQIGVNTSQIAQWYYVMYANRSAYRKTPSFIPQHKQSHPYCFTISKIQGLSVSKKGSNSSLFVNLSGMIVTQRFDVLGVPFNFQFEQSLGRNDSRWDVPVLCYFHSRIDKNYQGLFLIIKVKILEIKESVIETSTNVGTLVIKNPFIEEENKVVSVFKELSEVEFALMPADAKAKLLTSSSSTTAQYSVESVLQLKKLAKIVPENTIFTYQNSITGLRGNYISRDPSQMVVKEGNSVPLTISYLQVHISEKYEQELVGYLKKIYPNQKTIDIKGRKIVMGYHNQYCLINPSWRKLELIDKEVAGQMRIFVFEALKEGEVIKVPFYIDKNGFCCGVVTVGLIYEVGGKEVEVACYHFLPAQKGEDISERMMVGSGFGAVLQMIPIPTTQKPTLLMEYECDVKMSQHSLQDDEMPSVREFKGRKIFDDQEISKQKEKLKEEIEKERLEILNEKEQMQKLKNQNHLHFQAEFEKKFQFQKQNLYKKQQMVETQYKEQVQRQIRDKFQLEEEIRKMTEKLKTIEEDNFKKVSVTGSHYNSNFDHENSPRFNPKQEISNMPMGRQRMDPGHIIQPQNPVPVKRVRQIIQRGPKVSSQLIKQSQEQFNQASKFTFSFISVVWSQHVNPHKNIHLVLRFFNQKEFKTDNLSYLSAGENGYHQLMRTAHFSQGYEAKEPSYSFLIDPSQYHQPHLLQKDLIGYLANNAAIIDVYCGESHLYIGQINVKLKELIRGTKNQTLIAKELNLIRLKDKENLGVMQILIKNEQVSCKEEVSIKYEKKMKEVTKKIVSNNPIFISANQKLLGSHESDHHRGEPIKAKGSNSRQEMRIQRFKDQKAMKTLTQTASGFQHLQENQKGTVLNQIINYKERKMENYIKGVYAGLLNEQINLSAHYGKAVTFPFLFQNTSQFFSSYKISILFVGEQTSQELSVVKSNKQWRYFVAEHNYSEPKRYDMIGQNNTFFLHPGESIPLIFKFLSFNSRSKSSGQKVINVTICKQDNNWIAGGFSLFVQMHQPVIHHSYIFYEPGDQIVDLIVPVIYSQTDTTSTPKKLHLTDSSSTSTAQWLNPYEILIRVSTPKIMEKIKFNLLLYNDEYFCELSENWLIQIHSYEGVCAYFRSDFNTKFKITMPWSAVPAHLGLLSLDGANSALKMYSSSSSLIFRENMIELQSDRREEGGCEIWCQFLGGENTHKSAEITCVSGEEGELIYGWTATVYPYVAR